MLVILAVVSLLVLPFALYWLADAWLESAGGRQMLEQELSRRAGMSVRLEGEFSLMLLPAIGVSGTDLVISSPAGERSDRYFARSRAYEVSIALKPLWRRQVVIEWVRLTGGAVYPDRLSTGFSAGGPVTRLPEVKELALRDFRIVPGEDENAALHLQALEMSGFSEGRRAEFRIEIESLAGISGWLLWDTAASQVRFGDLRLNLAGQDIAGRACLQLQDPRSLDVELEAATLDLDSLREKIPSTGKGGELPVDIRLRLAVEELRFEGAVARGVELGMGEAPACD